MANSLIDALGTVVANLRVEWGREMERLAAESRTVVAEMQLTIANLKNDLKEVREQERERVNEVILKISSIVPERGPRGEKGEKGEPGEPGQAGKDGLDGNNGIDGKDGRDGQAGRDGMPGPAGDKGRDGIDGKDGAPGRDGIDGKDGIGTEDLTEELEDGGRYLMRRYIRDGQIIKEFRHITGNMVPRGLWKQRDYKIGDVVAWDGSTFVAEKNTSASPDSSGSGWRLLAQRGRNGKDGKDGKDGKQGPEGKPGRDLTQLGPDGSKW